MRIAWWGIADYNVSDPNTAGMARTNKVDVLLSAPSAEVQEWTRGLEPTNGGTVFPSEVLPPAFTTGRVARVIPPRSSLPAPDAWAGICVLETPSIQPTDKSYPSAIMSTDLCTSKLLEGLYGVSPTMKILPTQPMIDFSMEEIDMTVSEHFCCLGGGYGTDPKEATYLRTLPQYLGFAQDGPTPVYKDNTTCIEWGNNVIGGRERAKQIDVRKHFAHEAIKNGHLILKKVPTMLQAAAGRYHDQGCEANPMGDVHG